MDVCMRPESPNDTNKENISVSKTSSIVAPHVNPVEELMDYSEDSDSERIDTADLLSTIPSGQESGLVVPETSDSEVQPIQPIVVKNNTTSEPEDGELTYEGEELSHRDSPVGLWEPWHTVTVTPEKLAERAKRFGLNPASVPLPREDLLKLYGSFGISLSELRSGTLRTVCLRSLNMYGVKQMDSTDVLNYFQDYEPQAVRWIDDFSCNVKFLTETSAAKALVSLTSEKIIDVKDSSSGDLTDSENDTDSVSASQKNDDGNTKGRSSITTSFETSVPPGKWRKGRSCAKSKFILLRFAPQDERKIREAEKRSLYYQNRGNSNFEDSLGLSNFQKKSRGDDDAFSWARGENKGFRDDTRKRNDQYKGRRAPRMRSYFSASLHGAKRELSSDSDDEQNILSAGGKRIRMRMYADEVEGSWQKGHGASRSSFRSKSRSPVMTYTSCFSGHNSDEERNQHERAIKKDVPSRYKIWNPIAENMARESELAEQAQRYGFSRYQRSYVDNDLRSKIRVTSRQSHRQVTNSNDGDLRRKLQFNRKDGRAVLKSPLLISVRNRQVNE